MPIKVCILGDSVAKGVVLDDARGRYIFAKESAARLFAQDGGMEVDNLASFGCTVTKGEEMLQKCGPRIGDYDYTVLEFGGYDCDFDWKSVSDDPEASHICKTPLETFKQKYARMLETIKRFGGKPVVLNLPPIDSGRYFRWISRNLSPSRILRFLKEVGFIGRWQEMFNIAAVQVASAAGVPVIDIRSAFLAQPDFRSYLCADGIHPNEAGQKLIYGAIRRQLPSAT